jgi:homoaconitase/3-isopropylmalate dehydratase large subunit
VEVFLRFAYARRVSERMRAQAAGQLRNDFVPEDLVLLLIANAGVVRGTREATPGQMYRAMRRLGHIG